MVTSILMATGMAIGVLVEVLLPGGGSAAAPQTTSARSRVLIF